MCTRLLLVLILVWWTIYISIVFVRQIMTAEVQPMTLKESQRGWKFKHYINVMLNFKKVRHPCCVCKIHILLLWCPVFLVTKMAVTVQPKIYDGRVHKESKCTVHNKKDRYMYFTFFYFNWYLLTYIYIYIYIYIHTTYTYIHTVSWIHKWVIKTVGCGTSQRYTNIQTYSVKYYKHFTKTVL